MHKHAEVLKAIAEGKPIERRITGLGGDCWRIEEDLTQFNPLTYPGSEWRVAPDKQIVNAIISFRQSWLHPCIIVSWNGDVIPDGYAHNLKITNNHHIRFIFEEEKLVKVELTK